MFNYCTEKDVRMGRIIAGAVWAVFIIIGFIILMSYPAETCAGGNAQPELSETKYIVHIRFNTEIWPASVSHMELSHNWVLLTLSREFRSISPGTAILVPVYSIVYIQEL